MAHRFHQPFHFRSRMLRRQRDPQPRGSVGHGGRANGGYQQPAFEQCLAGGHGGARVAQQHGLDRRHGVADREAGVQGQPAEQCCVRQHALAPPGLGLGDAQCGACCRGHRRRQGRRVDVGTRALDEQFDEVFTAGDERAEGAEGLAQRAHQDRHVVRRQAPVLERAAPGRARHAQAVRIVDHEPCAVAFAAGGEPGQRRHVAVHAEHAIRHHQRGAGPAVAQLRVERGDVAMRVAMETRAAQPAGVEQRGVVQHVLEDRVGRRQQRAGDTEVRHVAGREQERARPAREVGQRLLEFVVLGVVPGDEVRGAAAHAVRAGCPGECLGHGRVPREAQVVVGAEGQALAAVHDRLDRAAAGSQAADQAPVAIQAARGDLVQPVTQQRHARLRSGSPDGGTAHGRAPRPDCRW